MIGALDVIALLPGELAARLESDEYFSDVAVVVADKGDVRAEYDRKTAALTAKSGKRGLAVIVLPMEADDDMPNVALGPMRLRPSFQVVELRTLNNTGKTASQVARRVRDVIKPLQLQGLTTEFVPETPCIESLNLTTELGDTAVGKQVNFACYEADGEEITVCGTPTFAPYADTVPKFALASATTDAEIWYSTDDSFPAPGRAGSAQYLEPIAIADTVTVRACAYKTGCIPSQVNRATLTVDYS